MAGCGSSYETRSNAAPLETIQVFSLYFLKYGDLISKSSVGKGTDQKAGK